jgi:1,4-dihydroxy-2-naphthoate octaprenyltransferase
MKMSLDDIFLILKLGRFHFLLAGFFSFTAGALLAVLLNAPLSIDRFLLGYAVLLPAHLSVSYSNDYFDVEVDRHTQHTIFTGGSGVLIDHPHLRPISLKISLILITISAIISFAFSIAYSTPIFLLMSFAGIFLAWFYSAPPLKMAYRGWGEVAMIISGFLIPGLGFVAMKGMIDLQLIIFTLPTMIYQLFFIMSVEIPDLEGDRKGNKYTFVVTHGRLAAFKLLALSGVLSTALFILMAYSNLYFKPNFLIVGLISLIPGLIGLWSFKNRTNRRTPATKLATYCLASLFLFIILVDGYFFSLI